MNEELLRVLAEVCESLAFLTPMGPAEPLPIEGQQFLVEIGFSGPRRGRCLLALGTGIAAAVAGNLAPDHAATLDDCGEAAKELGNVVAGNALPALLGEGGEFHLDAPRIVAAAALPADSASIEFMEGVVSSALVCED